MATVLKGKDKGKQVAIHQFCNDWFYLANGKIVSPTSIQLDLAEMHQVLSDGNTGFMFGMYELRSNGTFKKIPRTGSTGPR